MAKEHGAAILQAFEQQVGWCRTLGSPFTAEVVAALAGDIAAGGPTAALVEDWPGDAMADALSLRLAGALHALALLGDDPALARLYGEAASPDHDRRGLRDAVSAVVAARAEWIRAFIASPPQTNEVGRSAVLLGGFLRIAAATRLPLQLLEIGASAGLNQNWDRYHYRLGSAEWGDPASPVRLAPAWTGAPPPIHAPLQIAGRAACDIAPVDLGDSAQRLRLKAFVWADQTARLERLDGAIAIARDLGTHVERADAAGWVAARLREPAEGRATVLYHSIMWQYMPAETRAAIAATMQDAADRATLTAPLAWLRFEPIDPTQRPELRSTLWPSGAEERLATAQAHGSEVAWLNEP